MLSVLLSASVKRWFVSCMQDFFFAVFIHVLHILVLENFYISLLPLNCPRTGVWRNTRWGLLLLLLVCWSQLETKMQRYYVRKTSSSSVNKQSKLVSKGLFHSSSVLYCDIELLISLWLLADNVTYELTTCPFVIQRSVVIQKIFLPTTSPSPSPLQPGQQPRHIFNNNKMKKLLHKILAHIQILGTL